MIGQIRNIVLIILLFLSILIKGMSIEMSHIFFVRDIHVNFQLFTMIFSGNIVKDLISEDVYSFIQFIFVLYIHVT